MKETGELGMEAQSCNKTGDQEFKASLTYMRSQAKGKKIQVYLHIHERVIDPKTNILG